MNKFKNLFLIKINLLYLALNKSCYIERREDFFFREKPF